VFVKLDTYTGTQLSTDVDKQNIVPFTECVHEIKLTVNGTHYMRWQLPLILTYSITTHKSQSMTAHNGIVYEPSKNKPFARGLPYVAISRATDIEKVALLSPIRPDLFINKTFIAENIKITEFYNNLNKKFNSDEEI
jgi:ATP-dependent exoDNAse (exonuclease V) alpha subunit